MPADPLTIALLGGSIGTGVLGSIFGSSAQKSSNKTNLQIARETNAANAENYLNYLNTLYNINSEGNINQRWLQQNQQVFNAEQAAKQRLYDSPTAQVQRLMDAGLNPALVTGAGGGQSAPVSGLGSAVANAPSAPPSNVRAEVQPVTGAAQGLQALSSALSNFAIANQNNATVQRGQNINKAIEDESNRLKASEIRVKNELGTMSQAETERMGASQRALNDSLIESGNLQAAKLRLDLENYDKVLKSSLDLNDAQMASFYGNVRNSAAAVKATLADIAARLQMSHNDRADAMNKFGAQLEQDWNKFVMEMALQGKYYNLSEQQIVNAIELSMKEFQSEHGGLNIVWDFLGLHPDKIAGAVSNVYLGKSLMGKSPLMPPTKQTTRNYYDGGYIQYDRYYPPN